MTEYRKLAERLRTFNKWRRGGDEWQPMPQPAQIGKDIDEAIRIIEEYAEKLENVH